MANDILSSYILQKERIKELQSEIDNLKYENVQMNIIISDPLLVKVRKFVAAAQKTVLYRLYSTIRYGKISSNSEDTMTQTRANVDMNKKTYDHLLSLHEYRFLKYKKQRDQYFRINLNKIAVPYKKNLVSVILPVYNGDDYIELSIESVLGQTYKEFELIIVDDGSTDKTPQIVDRYAMLDKRIKVIHQENLKLPRALSRGFQEARGEFFTWTSADNIMSSNFLQKFVDDMKKYDHSAMLYGNVRLIDAEGHPKTDFGWYAEDQDHPENVIFPQCILELNTVANNYINAAFMYRAIAANVVEDYSVYKYGIEDYDYWMKINELFILRHVSFQTPEYSYRLHPKSLTSKDKELKITENRYKQMLLDDFRRDYFLKEMFWIIDADDQQNSIILELRNMVNRAGHRLITVDEAQCQTINLYERCIYVYFDGVELPNIELIPKNAFKVFISVKPEVNELLEQIKWDAYICNGEITENDYIGAYKGWFGIKQSVDIFAFVDSKARNRFLYELEADDAENVINEKQFSIIVSYSGNQNNLRRCLESVEDIDDTEVIVVGNSNYITMIDKFDKANIRWVSCLSENDITKKNVAARMAKGEYLVFLQDDCLVDKNYFLNLSKVFRVNEKIAVVFGQVDLLIEKNQNLYSRLLGEYRIERDDIYQYNTKNIPSGYSFSARRECFGIVGGFYHIIDYAPEDFCDILMLGLGMALQKYGYYIYLSSECKVKRMISEFNENSFANLLMQWNFGKYYLETNAVFPYEIWPEAVEKNLACINAEISSGNDSIWQMSRKKSYEKLLEMMNSDFQEKEMAEFNRDLFSKAI